MKGFKTTILMASLFFLGACTVTTTTDKDGNVSKSYSFGSSGSSRDDLFAKVSDLHTSHLGKLKQYDSIHYFSGFGDHKASISTVDNIISGRENYDEKVDLDFHLKADFNNTPEERYLLSILIEKNSFSHTVKTSDQLSLILGSTKLVLKPSYISDFFKSSSRSVTTNGSESFQKEVRDFLAINFNIDEQLIEQILESRDTRFDLTLSDGTTISGKLGQKNYEIQKEFSKALSETLSAK